MLRNNRETSGLVAEKAVETSGLVAETVVETSGLVAEKVVECDVDSYLSLNLAANANFSANRLSFSTFFSANRAGVSTNFPQDVFCDCALSEIACATRPGALKNPAVGVENGKPGRGCGKTRP